MEFLQIILASLGAVVALFLMTKLIGNKQMSQLNLFDYINGITIGSIGAELATNSDGDFWKPLTGLIAFGLATYLISVVSDHSIRLRRVLEGRSLVLYQNGKLYASHLKKAKLDLNEFLTLCRVQGYFDLSEIYAAVFEPNGQISILPMAANRPATPADLNLQPQQSLLQKSIIIDGKVLPENLKMIGRNEIYLQEQLKAQHLTVAEVFLGLGDTDGIFTFYPYVQSKTARDPFQ